MISLFYMTNFGEMTDHGLSLHWRYPTFAFWYTNLHGIERGRIYMEKSAQNVDTGSICPEFGDIDIDGTRKGQSGVLDCREPYSLNHDRRDGSESSVRLRDGRLLWYDILWHSSMLCIAPMEFGLKACSGSLHKSGRVVRSRRSETEYGFYGVLSGQRAYQETKSRSIGQGNT